MFVFEEILFFYYWMVSWLALVKGLELWERVVECLLVE